ncbi:hypothetical protein CTAYLR_009154 [Chrysophaeum taylorii]|uniref:Vesicle-fusing ATPase n=1 Tax=Chrysophaeum taylorii TaxID=2483200 RepID=A0AAD7XNV7_9STRA|nr:hypothetical protein CTAYLR_009154 [Chrysophaeum taylorii]
MLEVDNSPSKQAAYTNKVYMHPSDFKAYKARSPDQGLGDGDKVLVYVRARMMWVFTASPDAKLEVGSLGVSTLQRRTALLELGDRVEVEPFLPTPSMAVESLKLSVSSMQQHKSVELDAQALGEYFKKEYLMQVFAVGQKLAIAFRRTALEATVEAVDFGQVEPGRRSTSRFGQVIGPSRIAFQSQNGVKLTNNPDAPRVNLFNSDFDFGKLGIGGLQSEFNTIFRRAFASRIYPAHIIQQLGITHVRGMLLHGPPGCGKTLIARQIGKVLNAREPKIVNGPEILDKYVGASEEKIRELFADAEVEQKSKGDESMLHIIIFDEMDAIMKSRGSSRDGTGVQDSIVNQLLAKIDGVDSLNNILIIGMTNRKDMIDEAILRPGRLELHVEIGLPDEAGRLQILEIKTASMRESNRIRAVDLPKLAKETKNYSGAELEGLVKAAASYALRRCVDVTKMKLDESQLAVGPEDFDLALSEVQPAFGVNVESLEQLYQNGIVEYGRTFVDISESLDRLVAQVKSSEKTPLMTVLLEGPPASGKTALAASKAVTSRYPFIRLLAADKTIGYGEASKCTHIHNFFMDSYKSPLSLLVVDDIERLVEYSPIGPRFSNAVLQTLLVLLKKPPVPKNHRLLVICTTSLTRQTLRNLELFDVFNVLLHVPKLSSPTEFAAVLANQIDNPQIVDTLANNITSPIGVKHLLMVTEMAKQSSSEDDDADASPHSLDVNQFLFCLNTVIDDA